MSYKGCVKSIEKDVFLGVLYSEVTDWNLWYFSIIFRWTYPEGLTAEKCSIRRKKLLSTVLLSLWSPQLTTVKTALATSLSIAPSPDMLGQTRREF
ncbi:hypothetical protein CEXT_806461 [Caerostris extrusa]|uniref:Uncharacterized protein n=1 Tax=Caerostris extrusa TaxID=172846 RepID=A0AAV4UCI5_CAEEX|nr:hypothetical protein CEXT_806461 [Caerostris extrusa]